MTSSQNARQDPRDAVFDVSDIKENVGRRAGQASVLLLFFAVLKFGLGLISIAILARLIPPSEFGVVALAMPMVALITNVSGMGLGEAVVQRPKVTHRLANALFWINAALAVLSGLILIAVAPFAASYFDEPRAEPVFAALGVVSMIGPLNVQFAAVLRRRMQVQRIENVGILSNVLALVAAVATALAGLSYWAIVVQTAVAPLVMMACFITYAGWRPSAPWDGDWQQARSALGFGGALAVNNFVSNATNSISTLMVGRFFDPTGAGLYLRAQNVALILPTRFVATLSNAFLPTLSRLQDEPDTFNLMFARMVTRANIVMIPVGIVTAVGADSIVWVLMGPDWLEAAPFLAIFSVLVLQAPLSRGINWAMVASGRTVWMMLLSIYMAIASLLALWWGAGYGLVVMVAARMGVMLLIRLPLLLFLAQRATSLGLSAFRAPLLDGLLAGFIIAGLLMVRPYWPQMNAFVDLITLTTLVGALWSVRIMLDPPMRTDMKTVLSLIRDRVRRRRKAV